MLKNRFGLLLLMSVLVLGLAFLPACSDDDDNPTTPQGDTPPTFVLGAGDQIELPQGLQYANDPNASAVMGYAALANGFTAYTGFFTPPTKAAAADGPPWVYTWTVTQLPTTDLTFTLTVDETSDSYTWEYRLDGFDDGDVFDNVVFYEAEVAKDGSWGEMYIFDPEVSSSDPVLAWEWSESALGVFTMEMQSFDDDPVYIEFVVNPDGSGTLDIYEWVADAWRTVAHYEWTALGNGSYIIYNYDGGSNITGTCSAGTPTKN